MEMDEEFANGPYVRTRVTANTSVHFKVPGTITRFRVASRLSGACLVPYQALLVARKQPQQ